MADAPRGATAPILPTGTHACPVPEAKRHYCSRCGHSGDYAGTGPHTCPGCECELLPVPSGATRILAVDPVAFPNTSSTTANPPELLQRLSLLMQAAGLETCHPWREVIAQCLAKAAGCKRAPFGPEGRLVSLDQTPAPIVVLRQLDAWFNQASYSSSHPWRMAIAATLADHPPPPTTTTLPLWPAKDCGDRVRFELHPVLAGLSLLTNSVRVLRAVDAHATLSGSFADALKDACPSWADPFAHGGEASAEAVVSDLARYAADLCTEILVMDMNGGAA